MQFQLQLLAASILPSLVTSVQVAGYLGGACMGGQTFSYNVPTFQNCIDVSEFQGSESVIISSFNAGQVVNLYASNDCSGDSIYNTLSEVCYTGDLSKSVLVAQSISGRLGGGSLRRRPE